MSKIHSSAVNKSILMQQTTFGVDDWLFVMNVCLCILIVGLVKLLWWLPIALVLHGVLMVVTKIAPKVLETYVVFMFQATHYTPRLSPFQTRRLRPKHMGRGVQR